MSELFVGPSIDWMAVSPVIALLCGAVFLIVVGSLTRVWPKGLYGLATSISSCFAIGLAINQWRKLSAPKLIIGGAISIDKFSLLMMIAVCGCLILVSLVTSDQLKLDKYDVPEIYALYLTAGIGAIIMCSANDLTLLFLGLETLSLSFYLLTASSRKQAIGKEAALKYFILGGFTSALFLYGIALVYGVTGSTRLLDIDLALDSYIPIGQNSSILLVGIGLMVIGLAFKASLVPFHSWTPDVYEGAPTHVTSVMASIGKIAAISALTRVLLTAFGSRVDDWRPLVWVLSVVTLLIGSVIAVVQTDVKRMLAYSAISHAGFILVGLESTGHGSRQGISAMATYLSIYSVLVIGTFAVVSVVARGTNGTALSSFAGLASKRPAVAVAMTLMLLAQAGVPLTSGFVAKFGVIQSAVTAGSYKIAIIAMVSAVIAAYVYLRIVVSIWYSETTNEDQLEIPLLSSITIWSSVIFTLVIGLAPSLLISIVENLGQLAGA